jgi:hypothetical protein
MAEIASVENNRRFFFSWVPEVIFRPRRAFQRIALSTNSIWLTPLLILTFLVLVNVLVAGKLKSQAAAMGEISYPPNYQYYTPEQQAQYTQAIQSTQGPVFVYILPAITSILGVWIGWLLLGGILHLVTTLLGGRGSTAISMNIVAWGSIPFAVRALVQIFSMLISNRLISNPGLSGFSPAGDTGWLLFVGQILRLIDIYIIWQILLLILGTRLTTGITATKSASGVILTILIIIALQAGFSYLGSVLGNLTITRPFFF